ncbi:MAG: D-alanyl-D-alanine carboxypeptidase family protein [Campylobacterota bacterium]|nr:D-alanyl-D-alanine carboxypeptidase family protein [Campylobacterota bacterium]
MNRRAFFNTVAVAAVASASPLQAKLLKYAGELDSSSVKLDSSNDVIVRGREYNNLVGLSEKIRRVRSIVGFGNFNLVGFDEMRKIGRSYSKVGKFTAVEDDMFERIFYENANKYGFYGEKLLSNHTDNVFKEDTTKVKGTGHYIYKGKPTRIYSQIKDVMGDGVILTSGVRGIVKQMDLFLRKTVRCHGNVSAASYSLAPAGYSYHSIGDFDIGKVGWGHRNFTEDFATTDEYKKLKDLGYLQIRYTQDNPYGVRYEPWHVKVV